MSSSKLHQKLYVGCALTNASGEFKQQVDRFKESLRTAGFEVFDFLGLVAGTPADVYAWDIGHCVKDADAFIAICDHPSLGLGAELMEATRLGKPVLAVAHHDARITRLLVGMAEHEPNVTLARYGELETEVLPMVAALMKNQSGGNHQ